MIIRAEDGWFYVYGTTEDWHDSHGRRIVPVIRSRDLVQWEYVDEVFDAIPQWLDRADTIWATDIIRYRGQYHIPKIAHIIRDLTCANFHAPPPSSCRPGQSHRFRHPRLYTLAVSVGR